MLQRTVGLAFALTLGSLPAVAQTSTADQQVLATVRAFHDALVQGDSLAALHLLADEVAILESGGLETRADYRGHHLSGDIAFARAVSRRSRWSATSRGWLAPAPLCQYD